MHDPERLSRHFSHQEKYRPGKRRGDRKAPARATTKTRAQSAKLFGEYKLFTSKVEQITAGLLGCSMLMTRAGDSRGTRSMRGFSNVLDREPSGWEAAFLSWLVFCNTQFEKYPFIGFLYKVNPVI